MTNKHLAAYLNDHLAGSSTLLELLPHLEAAHSGTDLEHTLAELRAEITADRHELEALMERLHISQSIPLKAAAWLAEKVTRIKLILDDLGQGSLHLLEALELIAIGIEGKKSMWEVLESVADRAPGLDGLDYSCLIQKAEDQHRRVNVLRLEAAALALTDPG